MEFVIRIETRLDDRIMWTEEIVRIERDASEIGPEEVGLTLRKGKAVWQRLQDRIVYAQIDVVSATARPCARCGKDKAIKDRRPRKLRTVFGIVPVSSYRYVDCPCCHISGPLKTLGFSGGGSLKGAEESPNLG